MEDLIMKKSIVYSLALIAALSMIISCQKEQGTVTPETVLPEGEQITITATFPEKALTKVDFEAESDDVDAVVNLKWHSGDQIVVTDATNPSNTQTFTLKDGEEGKTTAQFTGAELTAASTYIISYNGAGGLDYANQTQAGDATTDHLKYAATLTGVNGYTDFTFSQAWATANGGGTFTSSSVLRLIAKLPSDAPFDDQANIKAVIFKASAPIFAGGNQIKVNITDASDDQGSIDYLTVYASLPAGDQAIAAGTEILVQFQTSANAYDKYTAYRKFASAKTLLSGKVNNMILNCENVVSFANATTDINGDDTDDIGTSINPYLIGDQHQMKYLMDLYAAAEEADPKITVKYYETLVDDIDLTDVDWTPFNRAGDYKREVYFDGNNKTISNLNVGSSVAYPSFFGVVYGTVKDVTFESPVIDGGSNNAGVVGGYIGTGSLNGVCSGITINNATVTVTVNAAGKGRQAGVFGGQLGTAGSSISDCHVTGTTSITNTTPSNASTASNVGGFIGFVGAAGTITDCTVSGTAAVEMVTTKTGCSAGGFVGNVGAAATISGCTAAADVENLSSYYTGGFIGQIGSSVAASFSDCAFLGGTITSNRVAATNSPVAGFVGRINKNAGASFSNCHVDGAIVSATNGGRCGGFVGDSGDRDATHVTTFTSCYVKNSSVSAAQHSGGFAGVLYTKADKCYVDNTTITANDANNGGFVGYPQKAEISDCYVTSSVVVNGGSYDAVGGFLGIGKGNNTITSCYEAATVTGTGTGVGAFIGYQDAAETSVTKCIAWNGSLSFYGKLKDAVDDSTITGNYTGTSGTISAQATTLGWDDSVWDLTDSVPTLK